MYWKIVVHRVSDMSSFNGQHSTQCHAVEVVLSRHVKSHHHIILHYIISYHIISYHITLYHHITSFAVTKQNRTEQNRTSNNIIPYHIMSNTDTAAATDTQTVISLTYQPEIPQDII